MNQGPPPASYIERPVRVGYTVERDESPSRCWKTIVLIISSNSLSFAKRMYVKVYNVFSLDRLGCLRLLSGGGLGGPSLGDHH